MAFIDSVKNDIHCLPNIVTWDEYLTIIAGLFCKSYLVELEERVEWIHILFDEFASSSSNVDRKPFDPLVLYPHNHSSQFDMTVATIEKFFGDTPFSLDKISLSSNFVIHPSPLGYGLSSYAMWPRTLDVMVTYFGIYIGTPEQSLEILYIFILLPLYSFQEWEDILHNSLVFFLPKGRNIVWWSWIIFSFLCRAFTNNAGDSTLEDYMVFCLLSWGEFGPMGFLVHIFEWFHHYTSVTNIPCSQDPSLHRFILSPT